MVELIATGIAALVSSSTVVVNEEGEGEKDKGGKRKRGKQQQGGLDAALAAVGVLPPTRALAMLDYLLGAQGGGSGEAAAAAKARALVLAAEAGEGEGEGRIRKALGAVRLAAAARVRHGGEVGGCGLWCCVLLCCVLVMVSGECGGVW